MAEPDWPAVEAQYIEQRTTGQHALADRTLQQLPDLWPADVPRSAPRFDGIGELLQSRADWAGAEVSACEDIRVRWNMGSTAVLRYTLQLGSRSVRLIEKIAKDKKEAEFYTLYHRHLAPGFAPALHRLRAVSAERLLLCSDDGGTMMRAEYTPAVADRLAAIVRAINALPVSSPLRAVRTRLNDTHVKDFCAAAVTLGCFDAGSARELQQALLPRLGPMFRQVDRLPLLPSHCDLKWDNLVGVAGQPASILAIDWGQFGTARLGSDLREFVNVDPATGQLRQPGFARRLAGSLMGDAPWYEGVQPDDLLRCAVYEQAGWAMRKIALFAQRGYAEQQIKFFFNVAVGCGRHLAGLA